MKILAMIMIALSLTACDVTVTETTIESESTMAITTSGQMGLKLNDVQCINMTTGQIEICIVNVN